MSSGMTGGGAGRRERERPQRMLPRRIPGEPVRRTRAVGPRGELHSAVNRDEYLLVRGRKGRSSEEAGSSVNEYFTLRRLSRPPVDVHTTRSAAGRPKSTSSP